MFHEELRRLREQMAVEYEERLKAAVSEMEEFKN